MRESIVAVFFSMASLVGYSQINSGSPAIPFGSNTAYSNGIMPTNLPTSGTYKASQDAAAAYDAWKNKYVSACTNGQSRVLFDDNSSTVSEGIGYGMLLSAYAGDKATFDALWKYYKAHSNGNGVMNWKYSNCDNSSGQNGATDAEEDAAMALIIAEEQWPTATSPYDYKSEATTLISKIRQFEIHPSSYQAINGDAWGFGNSCRNPSYFAPAYYREYAKLESSNSSFWNSATSTAQTFLLKNRNATTGLVSNWADEQAAVNSCNGPQEFGWDAIRNPWRMATDVLWNGSSSASTGSDICSKMSAWAKNDASNLKGPVALTSSGPGSGQYKNGTFSMIGLAFMAGGSSYQSALNTAYTSIVGLGNTEAYFSCTLRCITLFMMTGNFWKPGASTTPPTGPTATITPASATTFCSGGSVILNASTGTGYSYQWKKDNTTIANATSASYTATTSGSYVVVVTANNTSATSTATVVTVNSLPTANAGSDVSICAGKSTTLTATGGASYAWSNTVTTATNTVNPTTTTTYTVTVTDNNKCSASDAVVVTVNQSPTVNAGADVAICNGQSATLTASGGTGYVWSNNSNAASIQVSPTTTTTYTVSVTGSNGCIATDAVIVTVNSLPTANAGSDVSICSGKSTALTATGGTLYAWSNSVATATNTVNPTTTTTYTVTVTDNNKCSASDAVVVTVNQSPSAPSVVSPVNYAVGASATVLTATGTSLKWYSNTTGSALNGAPTPSTATVGTTSYYVSQSQNSCESELAKIDVVVSTQVVKIPLIAGWNLVGCPLTGSVSIQNALNSIWSEVECVKDMEHFYLKTNNPALNSLSTLGWGLGYWVKVTHQCDLVWPMQ